MKTVAEMNDEQLELAEKRIREAVALLRENYCAKALDLLENYCKWESLKPD